MSNDETKGDFYNLTSPEGKSIFRTWVCSECFESGTGGAEELFAHIRTHEIDSEWEEASNYAGE